jgi:hypothetical protein
MARMSPARTTWKRHPGELFVFLFALLAAAPALAADEAPPASRYGFAAGVFASQFIAGDAGPVTLVSETLYADTFDTGFGLRLEGYRNFDSGWRGQIGLVYSQWSGRFFTGGEFPAGAQFGDFSLYGIYIGGRSPVRRAEGFQPYFLGNLGLVHLSELTVVSGGTAVPYWTGNWRDYLELGAGVARRTGSGVITLDVRLQIFGPPEPATWPLAAATAGTTILIGMGYEWDVRR